MCHSEFGLKVFLCFAAGHGKLPLTCRAASQAHQASKVPVELHCCKRIEVYLFMIIGLQAFM
jgi:hypothetical protein